MLDTLKHAATFSDIAIVSSANLSAVQHEWETYHLTTYLNGMFAQAHGLYFYPILAGHENQSWLDFNNK